jgi:hypothetical protein
VALWFVASPAHAGWRVAESKHFRVFTEASAQRAVEQAALLEDYRALLVLATSREPQGDLPKLDVYVVRRMADASPYRPIPPTVAGFWRATEGGIAAFADDGESRAVGQNTLLHEYAHHFMLADTTIAYPAWYVEGFAEYFATATFRPDRIEFGKADPNRLLWLAYEPWLPLPRLLAGTGSMRSGNQVAMFYAQSWLLTHYVFRSDMFRSEEGKSKFRAYLQRTASGDDPVTAFVEEVEPDLPRLQGRLRTYITRPRDFTYLRMKRTPVAPADVAVRELPPSADRLLLKLVAIEQGMPDEAGAKLLADVRAEAAKWPGDPFAERVQVAAELFHGDAALALRLVDPLIEAAPTDATLWRWKGLAIRKTGGEVVQARRAFVRAFKADANDWRTLMAYVGTFPPDKLSDEAFAVLQRAWTLAPQVTENGMRMALALGFRGRLEEAATVLRPIAYSPHGGKAGEHAERLIALAEAGDRDKFLAGFLMLPVELPQTS